MNSNNKNIHHVTAEVFKETQQKNIKEVFVNRLQEIKNTAPVILDQFYAQKKRILRKANGWMGVLVEAIFSRLFKDMEFLKNRIQESQSSSQILGEDMIQWKVLCKKTQNHDELLNHVLSQLAQSTKTLIDRDIQVINEYKQHSLNAIHFDEKTMHHIENELEKAMDAPMRKLRHLRDVVIPKVFQKRETFYSHRIYPIRNRINLKRSMTFLMKPEIFELKKNIISSLALKDEVTLKQLSFWGMTFQNQRQNYFDTLLTRIDRIMENGVSSFENGPLVGFAEEEGDLLFIKRELSEIENVLYNGDTISDREKKFLLERIEGILDHLEEISSTNLPMILKSQLELMKFQAMQIAHYLHNQLTPLNYA